MGRSGGVVRDAIRRWRSSPRRRAARLLFVEYPGLALLVVGWMVAGAIAPMALLVVLGRVLADIPGTVAHGWSSGDGHHLGTAVLVLGLTFALVVGLNGVRAALGSIVKVRLTYRLHRRLMTAVSHPPGIAHLEDSAVLDRVALAQGTLMSYFPADAPLFLADVVSTRATGLLACLLVATFRWWLGVGLIVLNLLVRPRFLRVQQQQVALFSGSGNIMRRAFYFNDLATRPDAAKEIRVYGLGSWVVDQLARHWRDGMAASWANMARLRVEVGKLVAVLAVAYLVVVGYLARVAFDGGASVDRVVVVLGALSSTAMLGGMTFADVSLSWSMSALPYLDELEAGLRAWEARRSGSRDATGLPAHQVTFDRVHFTYPGSDNEVFGGLSLQLTAGRSTAIVGSNGAGKTTLVKLLAGLHEPVAGQIVVDGVPLGELDIAGWQRQVAVVFQDFNRYPLSAADNIGIGAPEHLDDREGMVEVAVAAGALEIIEALPQGWDTVLAPDLGGIEPSGGQWQRLALARALFAARHGARVLVLDEPTSWLDVRGEAAFYEHFLELTRGLTTVVISHRFSTVRLADDIYVIDNGRVIEQGSHDELVSAGGTYAEMFHLQAAHFGEQDDEDGAKGTVPA
jgi:ATP-binding cassette subfamily B protein